MKVDAAVFYEYIIIHTAVAENVFLLSGYSAAGSALALGARCRAFEPPYPDDFYRIYRICSSRLKYA